MSFSKLETLLVTALVFGATSARAQVVTKIVHTADRSSVANEIVQARDEHVAAVNAGQSDKIIPFYTDDALVILGENVVLRGKAEVARFFTDAPHQSAPDGSVTITPLAFTAAGNLGTETGTFKESRMTSSGSGVQVTGVYVIIYSRGPDGRWRIAMEVRTSGDHSLAPR